MQFLKIAPDARSAGVAGSYIAMANDASSLFWNPATIANVSKEKLHLQTAHTRYFSDISISSLAAVWRPGKQTFWGASLYSLTSGEMDETTEFQPQGTGRKFSISNFMAGLSFARVLTSNFSFGLTGKYAYEGYTDVRINNVMFDLGMYYNVGIKNTRFAITLSNFGINVQPQGKVTILKFNGEQTKDNFQAISVPVIFRIGAAFDPIDKENHKLTLSTQLNHPTDNNESIAFGAEYLIRKVFFVRTGYEFGQDENGIPPLGLGVLSRRKFGAFSLDYAFTNKSRLGNIHRITLGVAFK